MTNNEIKYYKKLLNKKYRYLEKKYIIEGSKIIKEAIDNNEDIIIYTSNPNKQGIIIRKEEIKDLITTETLIDQIAIVNMKNYNNITANNVLALDNIQDPGNLGTLIRSAIAFGYTDIILDNCVDPFNSKVIRSSGGSIFRANFIFKNIIDIINQYNDYYFLGTALKNALDINLFEEKIKKHILILGNEGNGVRKEILDKTNKNIYIKTNMESLNVSVAGSIIMHYFNNKKNQ